MRIVVLGGRGNFGARICRALASEPGIEVVAAGRAEADLSSPDFAARLKRLAPGIVVHCAGPFQGQDYRVAAASVAAGAHYLDLADGRQFVSGFKKEIHQAAHGAGVTAICGASTLPALSSAVVDDLAPRFDRIDEISLVIAPGQRAPRGAATLAGVFSYAGRSFKWLRDGEWRKVSGWQEIATVRIDGVGTRWGAACDVPDLELFPQRYPGVRTVMFRAALEFRLQHLALWGVAALRRCGIPLPLERWAPAFDRVASLFDVFGGDRGGMMIGLDGMKAGKPRRVSWHISVDAMNGPEIPCLAAILLARKLARGEPLERGAHACMGFLKLADFAPAFERWKMRTVVEEHAS